MFGKYADAYKKAKQATAQTAELTSLKGQVQKRLEVCRKELAEKRSAARSVYSSWHEENAATLAIVIQCAVPDGSIGERLKVNIREVETEFPPLLRVDWSAIDSQMLVNSARVLVEDILSSAVGQHLGPSLLVSQLRASGEEQLAAKLSSGNSLLEEIATSNAPLLASQTSDSDSSTVMLMVVPPDKKISVIKALREVREGLGLLEAMELVESAPTEVLEGATAAEAQQAKERLELAGAEVELL